MKPQSVLFVFVVLFATLVLSEEEECNLPLTVDVRYRKSQKFLRHDTQETHVRTFFMTSWKKGKLQLTTEGLKWVDKHGKVKSIEKGGLLEGKDSKFKDVKQEIGGRVMCVVLYYQSSQKGISFHISPSVHVERPTLKRKVYACGPEDQMRKIYDCIEDGLWKFAPDSEAETASTDSGESAAETDVGTDTTAPTENPKEEDEELDSPKYRPADDDDENTVGEDVGPEDDDSEYSGPDPNLPDDDTQDPSLTEQTDEDTQGISDLRGMLRKVRLFAGLGPNAAKESGLFDKGGPFEHIPLPESEHPLFKDEQGNLKGEEVSRKFFKKLRKMLERERDQSKELMIESMP